MGLVGRLIVTSIISAGIVLLVTFAWPLATKSPRPQALDTVYDQTKDTSLGQDIASVLGVSDEAIEPIDIAGMASKAVSDTGMSILDSVHEIVARQALNQLIPRYNALDERDKELLQEAICSPAEPEASTASAETSTE